MALSAGGPASISPIARGRKAQNVAGQTRHVEHDFQSATYAEPLERTANDITPTIPIDSTGVPEKYVATVT